MGDKIVLDLETQRDFSQVEGRRPDLLGVSIAGIYSYGDNRYDAFVEGDLPRLEQKLHQAELLIGFNVRKFDLAVLQPYMRQPLDQIPVLDILEDIVKALGHRLSLESVAQATLGRGKSGHGLEALEWFRQGRLDLITKYCLDDVKLTREVYEYGRQHGRLFATSRFGTDKLTIPVFWPDRKLPLELITRRVLEAQEKRLQVEIDYLAAPELGVREPRAVRRVDVYHVAEPRFEGYCHLRQAVCQFQIERVLDIKPTWQRFSVPADFVPNTVKA